MSEQIMLCCCWYINIDQMKLIWLAIDFQLKSKIIIYHITMNVIMQIKLYLIFSSFFYFHIHSFFICIYSPFYWKWLNNDMFGLELSVYAEYRLPLAIAHRAGAMGWQKHDSTNSHWVIYSVMLCTDLFRTVLIFNSIIKLQFK